MSVPPRASKPAKVPKVQLDKTYGPQPSLTGKYRTLWTIGFDLQAAFESSTQRRLVCKTNATCSFNVTAEFTTFTEPPLTGQQGYAISPAGFCPNHNHAPPFLPLDVDAENARLALLSHGDPSVDNPPLVPAHGFAGSGGSSVAGGGPGGAPGGGGAAPGFAESVTSGVPQGRTSFSGQAGTPLQQHQQQYSPAPPQTPAFLQSTPQPPPTDASYSPMMQQQQPPPQQMAPFGGGGGGGAPLLPDGTIDYDRCQQPLKHFLLEIHPSFASHLSAFAANSIPLETPPQDLLDLDAGTDDDRTLFGLFKDVKGLPLFLVALAADGVRKAKLRQARDPLRRIDPKIAVGLEKAKTEAWVRRKIAEGMPLVAAAAAAQQQQQQQQGQAGMYPSHL
ncbi:uncharacterized protein JCM10292_004624 [Rhodotorula paludigena]|uniref:uncharacterized protein n=1 Tax=Rhodotorula paludigena TaxID=86838 RepID=UPI00317238B0